MNRLLSFARVAQAPALFRQPALRAVALNRTSPFQNAGMGLGSTFQSRGAKTASTAKAAAPASTVVPSVKKTTPASGTATASKNAAEPQSATKARTPKPVTTKKSMSTESKKAPVAMVEKKLSPYANYVKKFYEESKKKGSTETPPEIMKKASVEWKKLNVSQKSAYEGVVVMKRARKIHRTVSSFDVFRAERLKALNGDVDGFKKVAEEWKKLSEDDKRKYEPVGKSEKPVRKPTAWQGFLAAFLKKPENAVKTKEDFAANVKKASAEFKKLGDDAKKRYASA